MFSERRDVANPIWVSLPGMEKWCCVLALWILISATGGAAQDIQIGIIDFYGLSRVSPSEVRKALTFKEGDTVPSPSDGRPARFVETENQLSKVPGVTNARVQAVCCDGGRAIVYIGIEEQGAAAITFRPEPTGDARLAADIVGADEELATALSEAVQRGTAVEDDSEGHSLVQDPKARAIQLRFISYARRDVTHVRHVLRTSSDRRHRAVAAEALGYAADKQSVVDDLVHAMSDPFEDVRNNAMRALGVMAHMTAKEGRPAPRIPHQPFIAYLSSPVWTDRNKAVGALMALSARRDPKLLASLRNTALAPLSEMARWKAQGHAIFAFMILGRIAGYSDDAVMAFWGRGERELIINAARK